MLHTTPRRRRPHAPRLILAIAAGVAATTITFAAIALLARGGDAEPIEGVITYAGQDGARITVRPDGEAVLGAVGSELDVVRGSAAGTWAVPGSTTVAFVDGELPELWLSLWGAEGVSRVSQLTDGESPPVFVGSKGDARDEGAIPLIASWSPDGGALAYGSARGETKVLHIATRGPAPDRSFVLTDGYAGELVWSPDGRSLALSTYSEDGRDHTVYVIDRESGEFTYVIDGCLIVWSPDSSYLALHRDPHRAYGIWLVSAGGGRAQQLTAEPETYPLAWNLEGDIGIGDSVRR